MFHAIPKVLIVWFVAFFSVEIWENIKLLSSYVVYGKFYYIAKLFHKKYETY